MTKVPVFLTIFCGLIIQANPVFAQSTNAAVTVPPNYLLLLSEIPGCEEPEPLIVPEVLSVVDGADSTLYFAVDDANSNECPEVIQIPEGEVTPADASVIKVLTSSESLTQELTMTIGEGSPSMMTCAENQENGPAYKCLPNKNITVPVSLSGLGGKVTYTTESGSAQIKGHEGGGPNSGRIQLLSFELVPDIP